jgi:hypothetical protein
MGPSPESLGRAEENIRALPGGHDLCARIGEAMCDPSALPTSTRAAWLQLGIDLVYCTGFPAAIFQFLRSEGDFDIRWPLTFAARYWGASGASVDEKCAAFLRENDLADEALEVLGEYTGEDWVRMWRERFARLLTDRPAG